MTQDPFGPQAADSFLMGGGGVTQVFPAVGFRVQLTALSWRMAQQTKMETGDLLFWNDGRPRMQMVMECQGEATGKTWTTNAYVEKSLDEDDGRRNLYVKGNLQKAIRDGLRDAGMQGPEEGMLLDITRGKSMEPKVRGQQGAHTFKVVVTPAAKNPKWAAIKSADAADFLNDTADDSPF